MAYGYDPAGQLISGTGFELGGTLRGNENFNYGYDPAGNLLSRTNNTLEQGFTTDAANQLLSISRNNTLTVAGTLAMAPQSLTINDQAATVYGDLTFAVTNGVPLVNGQNTFLARGRKGVGPDY